MSYLTINTETIGETRLENLLKIFIKYADTFEHFNPVVSSFYRKLGEAIEAELRVRGLFGIRTVGDQLVEVPNIEDISLSGRLVLTDHFRNTSADLGKFHPGVKALLQSVVEYLESLPIAPEVWRVYNDLR